MQVNKQARQAEHKGQGKPKPCARKRVTLIFLPIAPNLLAHPCDKYLEPYDRQPKAATKIAPELKALRQARTQACYRAINPTQDLAPGKSRAKEGEKRNPDEMFKTLVLTTPCHAPRDGRPLSQTEDEAREAAALCWPERNQTLPRCATGNPYQLAGGRLLGTATALYFPRLHGPLAERDQGFRPSSGCGWPKPLRRSFPRRDAAAEVGISYNTAFKALTVLRLAILAQGADARQLMGPGAPLFLLT